MSTLAQTFEACARALSGGNTQLVLVTLHTLDRAALPPASARLYDHLKERAQASSTPSESSVSLLALDVVQPLAGVSIVSACMNREGNLLKVLPSWLASGADEIIIVDWSSAELVAPRLAQFKDPRLKVVRIDGEPRWILTHAFNVGLRLARHEAVFKLDADIELAPGFLAANRFASGEFVRGFWKQALDAGQPDQCFTNGSFGAWKRDLRAVGYYDERIQTYGWDDSDLYERLMSDHGLAGRLLAFASLRHLPQEQAQRLEHQAVHPDKFLGRMEPTELENSVNKFHSRLSLPWNARIPPQDYQLTTVNAQVREGQRSTERDVPGELRTFARALAARELAGWIGPILPPGFATEQASPEFGRLLRQAHAAGYGDTLVQALRDRRGLHLFRADTPALQEALAGTLRTVLRTAVNGRKVLVVVEDEGHWTTADLPGPCFRVSGPIVDALARATAAEPRHSLGALEAALAGDGCTRWNIGVGDVIALALAHRAKLAETASLNPVTRPIANTALVSSVYDEGNLLRLAEYLACMAQNLALFEQLLFFYETRNGITQSAIQSLTAALGAAPHRVALFAFDHRPTFAELFAAQTLLAAGTLLVAANADVCFDGTLRLMADTPLADTVCAISRRDLDDRGAHLIRLENGTPNTLSADAWAVRLPFAPDFHLDYPIGSYHCDSFINNQVGRSSRYRVINPCLNVHVLHLHDARFNSSAEKHVRDREQIETRREAERLRNGGESPVKGAPWAYLAHGHLTAEARCLMDWRPRALVVAWPQPTLGGLVWLHLAMCALATDAGATLVVCLPTDAGAGTVGRVLARYKQQLGGAALQFDTLEGASLDPAQPGANTVVRRIADTQGLLAALEQGGDALKAMFCALLAIPGNSGQMRVEWQAPQDSASEQHLLELAARQAPQDMAALREFIDSFEPWSDESRLLRPFAADLAPDRIAAPALHTRRPRVSLVTSMFRGGEFVPGYLENAAQAALACDGEVILVDANCSDADMPTVEAFFQAHPAARRLFDIVRPQRDPGLYACWQLAIERSRADLISNANLDDRRSPWHTRLLADVLEARPQLAGACGSISAVLRSAPGGWHELLQNQVWFHDLGETDFGFDGLFVTEADGTVKSRNVMHCMPVWRRGLHQRFGWFDEDRYGTSADWAFWLQCARAGERFHLEPRAFGRYYLNLDSHNRRNDPDGAKERRIIAELIGVEQKHVVKQ